MSKKKDQSEVFEGAQNVPGGTPHAGSDEKEGVQATSRQEPGVTDSVKTLSAEVADLKDKLLRKQADFENFRKRMLREREDASRYANAALLTDIIGLIDDFERAIRSAEESHDFSS